MAEGGGGGTKASKSKEKEFQAQIFAEDMAEDWAKDAVKIARFSNYDSYIFSEENLIHHFLPISAEMLLH
jgi:hypothetical protein